MESCQALFSTLKEAAARLVMHAGAIYYTGTQQVFERWGWDFSGQVVLPL